MSNSAPINEPGEQRIRPLKKEWGSAERRFKVLKREKDAVLVQARNNSGVITSYEVALIRKTSLHYLDTELDQWDLQESYPSNSQWGKWGWTWPSNALRIAETHFDFLVRYGRLRDFYGSVQYKDAKAYVAAVTREKSRL